MFSILTELQDGTLTQKPKSNYLVRLPNGIDQHDVLGLQVRMNKAELLQLAQREQHLLHHGPNALERQRRELVLLEKVVQVLLQHLEHETRVVLVLEDLVGAHQIVLVRVLLAEPRQDADLDLALPRIRRMILQDLDGDYLVGPLVPALDHLSERATAQELQHLVAVRHRIKDLVQDQLVVAFASRAVVVERDTIAISNSAKTIIIVNTLYMVYNLYMVYALYMVYTLFMVYTSNLFPITYQFFFNIFITNNYIYEK